MTNKNNKYSAADEHYWNLLEKRIYNRRRPIKEELYDITTLDRKALDVVYNEKAAKKADDKTKNEIVGRIITDVKKRMVELLNEYKRGNLTLEQTQTSLLGLQEDFWIRCRIQFQLSGMTLDNDMLERKWHNMIVGVK